MFGVGSRNFVYMSQCKKNTHPTFLGKGSITSKSGAHRNRPIEVNSREMATHRRAIAIDDSCPRKYWKNLGLDCFVPPPGQTNLIFARITPQDSSTIVYSQSQYCGEAGRSSTSLGRSSHHTPASLIDPRTALSQNGTIPLHFIYPYVMRSWLSHRARSFSISGYDTHPTAEPSPCGDLHRSRMKVL